MQLKSFLILTGVLLVGAAGCQPGGLLIRPVPADPELREALVHQDEGFFIRDKIAVVDVDGVLMNEYSSGLFGTGENPVSLFMEKIARARKDPQVKAIILRLDSPGGTVAASDAMYHALRQFRRETGKPVVACMLGVAASGAYYLACGADGIMAQPSTVTGSIGVMMQTLSLAGTMDKIGVAAVAIKSGKYKDMASPLKPLPEEEKRLLQEIIDKFYGQFLDVVQAGRKDLSPEKLRELADGRVYTADQAQAAGLIDRIGYPLDAFAWAKEMAQVRRARLVMYHRPLGYKPNIYAASPVAQPTALVNVELPRWLRAEGPQFLYLWQPEVSH